MQKKWFTNFKNLIPFLNTKETAPSVDFSDLMEEEHNAWWGTFSVEPEQSRYVKIANIVFCIDHYGKEWRIAYHREGQDKTHSKILAAQIAQGEIALKPTLPDRPVLFSLVNPLLLPAKAQLPLYVSTPIFIRIDISNPPILLEEYPSEILSDTWYGKTTQTGELCYYSSGSIAHRLEEIARDNTHVITPIVVSNPSAENVILKEIRLPANYFSIYSDSQNHLWTEPLSVTFLNAESCHSLVEKGGPSGLKDLKLLTMPRAATKSSFINLFNSF